MKDLTQSLEKYLLAVNKIVQKNEYVLFTFTRTVNNNALEFVFE